MEGTDAAISLNLSEEGQAWWSLLDTPDHTTSRLRLTSSEKGLGVIASSSIAKSSLVFSNFAVSSVLMHWNESEICMHCWKLINKSAKFHSRCRHLRYCSQECLQANDHYIAQCGKAVNAIVKKGDVTPLETQLLALNLLYNLTICSENEELQQLLYIFKLHNHVSKGGDEVVEAADIFYSVLSTEAPSLLREVRWFMPFDRQTAHRLFQIIRLNCQPMHIYGVKRYTVLCLLPTIARLNHSCQPNCELVLQIEEEGAEMFCDNHDGLEHNNARLFAQQINSRQRELYRPRRLLRVSVLAVTDITVDSELTISYLSNLYESASDRQHFLDEGFYFKCKCSRCVSELSGDDHDDGEISLREQSKPVDRLLNQQLHLETLLNASVQTFSTSLDVAKCEEIVQLCESLIQEVGRMGRDEGVAWSVASIYHACLLVIDDYQGRFRRLQGQWQDYITFGMIFFRAGKLMCDCWAQFHCPTRPARLDLMTKVCLYSALTAKPYLEHCTEISFSFPAEKMIAMVRGALAMSVEVAVIIDTVYLNNDVLRERESEVGTDDNSTLGDSWHYMRLLRDKAVRVRSYLRTATERIQEIQSQPTS